MRLTPQEEHDRVHVVAIGAVLVVAILSVGAALWVGNNTRDSIRSGLRNRSLSVASALDASDVAKLKGDSSDASSQEYKDLKTQLASVKQANPDARSVYLMGRKADGMLFFYVNSEQPGSHDYSPPGNLYPDSTAADKAIFGDGQAFVEGPTTDSFGTFIAGLAPVYKNGSSTVLAVLGIEIDSNTYWETVVYSAALPFTLGAVIILIILTYERIRRHNMQLLALRSELVSVASHELRNPITGIRWAAESLQKISTDERVLKMSKAILDSAINLQASTNDILELSHATNGRALTIERTDLVKIMQEVITTQALAAQQKGVTLNYDQYWPKSLVVPCDPDQMRRAIHNVVSNAIKYTRDNTPVVISYQQDDKHHKILVTDQGIGIPAAEQNKVFRGFYRASNAAKSNIPGTGLGLYLVKTVFERHGGNVSFISQENKGTTFILTLPKTR